MGKTWQTLIEITQSIISDRGGDVWADDTIRKELGRAALLITIHRAVAGAEKVATLNLVAGQPLYDIRQVEDGAFADLIWPLRATIEGESAPLLKTTFAAVSRLDPDWFSKRDEPESFFMVGANLFGIHPTPEKAYELRLTYLGRPPIWPPADFDYFAADEETVTRQKAAALAVEPGINAEWHDFLPLYAAAVLLVAEGNVIDGQTYMEQFMTQAGLPRDQLAAARRRTTG